MLRRSLAAALLVAPLVIAYPGQALAADRRSASPPSTRSGRTAPPVAPAARPSRSTTTAAVPRLHRPARAVHHPGLRHDHAAHRHHRRHAQRDLGQDDHRASAPPRALVGGGLNIGLPVDDDVTSPAGQRRAQRHHPQPVAHRRHRRPDQRADVLATTSGSTTTTSPTATTARSTSSAAPTSSPCPGTGSTTTTRRCCSATTTTTAPRTSAGCGSPTTTTSSTAPTSATRGCGSRRSVHVYNNYYCDNSYGIASTNEAGLFVEGNYFFSVNNPGRVEFSGPLGPHGRARQHPRRRATTRSRSAAPSPTRARSTRTPRTPRPSVPTHRPGRRGRRKDLRPGTAPTLVAAWSPGPRRRGHAAPPRAGVARAAGAGMAWATIVGPGSLTAADRRPADARAASSIGRAEDF